LLPAMPYLLSLCLEQCQIPMQSNQTFAAWTINTTGSHVSQKYKEICNQVWQQ
jgi:hypothetical protein